MGDRIRQLIVALGLKNQSFADALNVSAALTSQWKSGNRNLTNENINKIIDVFPEINRNWLISGTGNMFLNNPTVVNNTTDNNLFTEHNLPEQSTQTAEKIEKVEKKQQKIENKDDVKDVKNDVNNKKIIKKVIYVYSDGTFDTYFPND